MNSQLESFYEYDKDMGVHLDNEVIYNRIIKKYPKFIISSKESVIKKTFIEIINDIEFIKSILKEFDISFNQFFEIIYLEYGFIFNNYFINKIRLLLDGKYDQYNIS